MNYPFIPEEYSVVYGEGYEKGLSGGSYKDNHYVDADLYHWYGEGLWDALKVGVAND